MNCAADGRVAESKGGIGGACKLLTVNNICEDRRVGNVAVSVVHAPIYVGGGGA